MSKRNYLLAGVAVIVLVLGVWWFAGSGTAPEPSLQPAEAGKAAPGILPVDRKQAAQLGIRLVPAIAAIEAPIAVIPAVIQPPANARVAVRSEEHKSELQSLMRRSYAVFSLKKT